jgi:hypothetical protein
MKHQRLTDAETVGEHRGTQGKTEAGFPAPQSPWLAKSYAKTYAGAHRSPLRSKVSLRVHPQLRPVIAHTACWECATRTVTLGKHNEDHRREQQRQRCHP